MKKREAYRNKRDQQNQKRAYLFLGIICLVLIAMLAIPSIIDELDKAKREKIHQKAIKLGILGAPSNIEERHVWVSEHQQVLGRNGDETGHIIYRANEHEPWGLCGTGTRLGKYPSYVLTAYHVLEGNFGQYGYRKLGPNEFTGNERIIPVVSCELSGNADDSIVCTIDQKRSDYPLIAVPESTNMFKLWDKNKDYKTTVWPAKIRLSTYPELVIQNVLQTEVRPGTFHFFFDWEVMPGESGTSAVIDGEKDGVYLVVIRGQKIPKIVHDKLTAEQQKLLNWSEDKMYGVGNLMRMK